MLERHVAVGVDGSTVSTRAQDAAAEEATRRSVPLEIVYAVPDPATAGPVLTACAARARRRFPGLRVHLTPVTGDPAEALAERSRNAALMVVGTRALSGLAALTSRSVSRRLLDRARCPVLVVSAGACRAPGAEGSGVVLLVVADDTDVDTAAEAFAEAARRGFGVRFLHTGPRLPPSRAERNAP
ncbi:universal stress protein, partial [Streptomyces nanshensis]|uniref:universal stress protein n=1 Tax=Streptomyces nanshensis TaxID=518642 RepID=UPI00114D3740